MKVKSVIQVCLVLVCASGCGSLRSEPGVVGKYVFSPDEGMHHPYLLLSPDGRFAFVGGPEEAIDDPGAASTGRYRIVYDALKLTYDATELCKFLGVEKETITVLSSDPEGMDVRYRGNRVRLKKLTD